MRINIFKDFATLSFARFMTLISGLINAIVLTRAFSVIQYGTYSQIFLITGLAVTIFSLGAGASCNFFLSTSDSKDEQRNIISQMLFLNLMLGLIAALVIFALRYLITWYFGNKDLLLVLPVMVFLPLFSIFDSIFEVSLITWGKTKQIIYTRMVTAFIQILIAAITFILKFGVVRYLYLFFLYYSTYCIFVVFILIWYAGGFLFRKFDIQLHKRIFTYSVPIWISSIVGTVTLNIDQLFIAHVMGTVKLAEYTNMAKELPITVITASFTSVLFPTVVKLLKQGQENEVIRIWKLSSEMCFIILSVSVSIIFLLSPEIVSFLYSSKYITGVPVFRVYALILLFRVTYYGMILNATGNTKFVFYYSLIILFLNVFLVFSLWYLIGYTGPAWATLLSIASVAYIQLYHSSKILKCRFREIFPWKHMIYIILICMGCIIPELSIEFMLIRIGVNMYIRLFTVGSLAMFIYTLIFYRRLNYLKDNLRVTDEYLL